MHFWRGEGVADRTSLRATGTVRFSFLASPVGSPCDHNSASPFECRHGPINKRPPLRRTGASNDRTHPPTSQSRKIPTEDRRLPECPRRRNKAWRNLASQHRSESVGATVVLAVKLTDSLPIVNPGQPMAILQLASSKIPAELMGRLKKFTELSGDNQSAAIRQAIEQFLDSAVRLPG